MVLVLLLRVAVKCFPGNNEKFSFKAWPVCEEFVAFTKLTLNLLVPESLQIV